MLLDKKRSHGDAIAELVDAAIRESAGASAVAELTALSHPEQQGPAVAIEAVLVPDWLLDAAVGKLLQRFWQAVGGLPTVNESHNEQHARFRCG